MIKATHLTKVYKSELVETTALDDVSLEVKKGEFIAIMGPSGSGKSTLMHILGCLDSPTSGSYLLDGQEVGQMSDDELAGVRNTKIGFVFQAFNLLARRTALQNVMLPMIYANEPDDKRHQRAKELLIMVGLDDRMNHTPNQLSGGQQQRVAIARSLALDPAIILADEPTGNLASRQGEEIMKIFKDLNKKGHTIIIITHEQEIASYAKRRIILRDGKIVKDQKQ